MARESHPPATRKRLAATRKRLAAAWAAAEGATHRSLGTRTASALDALLGARPLAAVPAAALETLALCTSAARSCADMLAARGGFAPLLELVRSTARSKQAADVQRLALALSALASTARWREHADALFNTEGLLLLLGEAMQQQREREDVFMEAVGLAARLVAHPARALAVARSPEVRGGVQVEGQCGQSGTMSWRLCWHAVGEGPVPVPRPHLDYSLTHPPAQPAATPLPGTGQVGGRGPTAGPEAGGGGQVHGAPRGPEGEAETARGQAGARDPSRPADSTDAPTQCAFAAQGSDASARAATKSLVSATRQLAALNKARYLPEPQWCCYAVGVALPLAAAEPTGRASSILHLPNLYLPACPFASGAGCNGRSPQPCGRPLGWSRGAGHWSQHNCAQRAGGDWDWAAAGKRACTMSSTRSSRGSL